MESKLIKINDGYSLKKGDILNVMFGRTVYEMIVHTIDDVCFYLKDKSNCVTEEFYIDNCQLVYSRSMPVKILGVDINADIEPFTGWNFVTESNLPDKSKVCIFKNGSNVVTGWIDRHNKIFSTKGQLNPLDFKYYKELC